MSPATQESNINIPSLQRIQLNKRPARFHVIPHQRHENLIRGDRVFDLHFEQAADGWVHRGFPQLFRIHFTQTFVALLADAAFGFVA